MFSVAEIHTYQRANRNLGTTIQASENATDFTGPWPHTHVAREWMGCLLKVGCGAFEVKVVFIQWVVVKRVLLQNGLRLTRR